MWTHPFSPAPMLAHSRYNTFDFIKDLANGDTGALIVLAVLAGIIAFFAIYKRITGRDFVKSRKERREARKRRHHVLWEYERDR